MTSPFIIQVCCSQISRADRIADGFPAVKSSYATLTSLKTELVMSWSTSYQLFHNMASWAVFISRESHIRGKLHINTLSIYLACNEIKYFRLNAMS